jgi:hypothetical protein
LSNTERGKLRNKIAEKRASKTLHFFKKYRDAPLMHIDILTVLSVFSIVSMRNIKDLCQLHYRYTIRILNLEKCGCIKLYFNGDEEYSNKKLLLPNLYEKGMIIESMDHIKDIYNGAVFELNTFKKISLSQLPRKTKTPYRIPNSTIIIEITDKGRLLLKKYIKLYSTFFSIPEEKLTINKNVLGLFTKSVDELKKIVQKDDIAILMFANADSRDK